MNSHTHSTTFRYGRTIGIPFFTLLLMLPFSSAGINPYVHTSIAHVQLYLPMAMMQSKPVPLSASANWSTPVVVSPRDGRIWVVNPDSDSVMVFAGHSFAKLDELAAGQEPVSLAVTTHPVGPRSHIVIVNRAGGTLTVIEDASRRLLRTIAVGAEPGSVILTPTGLYAIVTLMAEDAAAFIALNDQEIFGSPVNNPTIAVPSPDGKRLYIVLSGSNLVEMVDIVDPRQPELVKFLAVGDNPQGLALNEDGTRGFVMNYLARSLTVLDLVNLEVVTEISTTDETLTPALLRSKILFNSATDPRLTQGSWISCASCHFEGLPDGVTWIFPDGPRQTPMLWNAGHTLPWHWSAVLDEAQDVEETIQLIQHGLGLGPGVDPAQLGGENAGRSADLDALALFLRSGLRAPQLPLPVDESETGRALFRSMGCAACHGGPNWTISFMPVQANTLDPDGNGMVDGVLRGVGTLNPLDGRGATGFDVPSLLSVGLTAPYFHDGSMGTLAALLATGHPDPTDHSNALTEAQIAKLVSLPVWGGLGWGSFI